MPSAETGLFLDGLRCAGCVNRVERELRGLAGVESASVDFGTQRALVRFDPDRLDLETLVARIGELGYSAVAYDPASVDRPFQREAREALIRIVVAAFLALNVMWIAIALYIGSYSDLDAETRRALRWASIALSLPAATWCALPFWRGALRGLRRGEITTDVPVVLGVATSFVVSIAATLAESHHLFADSAAMIVFLILLGRTLERRARARAAGAVERLAALTPDVALRRRGETLERVKPEALQVGDRVVVPAGQRVPADGHLASGESEFDEALLTGEALPMVRRPGDALIEGSRNLLAEVELEVGARVSEGTISKLAALFLRAQAEKPRVQQLADRVAARFAPAVLAIALLSGAAWIFAGAPALEAALTAASVLIVACPCALGLSTPAAVTAALGRAAALGILVKRGDAFERCAAIERVLLDKTGTASEGRFAVQEILVHAAADADEVLAHAIAGEGASTHPFAEALRNEGVRRALHLPECRPGRVRAGLGIEAQIGGETLRVGSSALLREAGVPIDASFELQVAACAARGDSIAWVARDHFVLGAIALSDPLRADAPEAVAALQQLGLAVALLTGDHAGAAQRAGAAAGIREVHAELAPAAKVEQVKKRQALGERVLFAGDGINDAAALAAADVGVAMARGSDLSLHAADVVIRSPRLGALPALVGLSRATLRRIRQNLGFALLYNAVAIPLAAAGWLDPLHAAIAMSLSSLVVVLNALRLQRWEPPA